MNRSLVASTHTSALFGICKCMFEAVQSLFHVFLSNKLLKSEESEAASC